MPATTPFDRRLAELVADFSRPDALWQLVVVAVALAAGWWASTVLERRVRARADELRAAGRPGAIAIGAAAFSRVLFPLATLTVLFLGHALITRYLPTGLLWLAVELLTTLALVRLAVYLLRKAFRVTTALVMFERWIAVIVWGGFALDILGLLPFVTEELDSVVLPLGKHSLSLLDLMRGIATIIVTLVVALWAGSMIETRLMLAEGIDSSLRVVFVRLIKALLVLAAVLIGSSAVGIDLTALSVFGGALGVGLGLGLQKIASNYVSGFVVLFERSLRLGDLVTVGTYSGVVSHIRTRYTVIRALDGTESILPNEMLVANAVVNQTYTDPKVRLSTRVQVAYGTDVEHALKVLASCAVHERIATDPAPSALLVSFDADGMTLELGFWIGDPDKGRMGVVSDVNRAVLGAFRREGIEIPFPQREVRLLGGSAVRQVQSTGVAGPAGGGMTTPAAHPGA
ncbi:mechanosensitive ion channel family protein [Derxia gummosa]|uniref:Mechanosensitive ion channel family protein n=1 Tax=Derxia gummosa DSM 723 TaxID=1121388 RepID=A0A8B6X8V8_9BURK|nr:mechanosensitive ion channel domain-containing protein [Derxia gummosa]